MITITVQTPSDFSFERTVTSHGWYQLAPNEYDTATQTLHRPYRLSNGTAVRLAIRGGKSRALSVTVHGRAIISSLDRNNIMVAVRNMFNLRQSLGPFYRQMEKTSGYEWIAEKKPARLLASPTVWEDLSKTLLTTNTAWNNTIAMARDLSKLDPHGIFATPQQITALSAGQFSDCTRLGYRADYLYEAAQRVASGELDVESWRELTTDDLYRAIKDLKGFGEYAAGTLMRLLGHHDRLAIDTVARKAYARVTGEEATSDTDIRDYYEPFGKWRGLALWMDCIRDTVDDTTPARASNE